ncbi:Starch-binding associating with outer membrane [Reichenbachiella faecimaris]|uniref:Starch-binding associating with outer membrane n=2 Tax=Reichenbachiella faecimaris TaxID=692418 RepID=A0A1W2GDN5_REIFA|nr:Starch-binding associating with outer membrane [Reichenbachiella faecimaris]
MSLMLALASCTGDFEEINIDSRRPTEVDPAFVLTGIQGDLMNNYVYTSSLNENETGTMAQYFAKHLYTDENVYDFRGGMFNTYWNRRYHNMYRMREGLKMIDTPPYSLKADEVKANQRAIFEILEIWTWTQLTDQFGDIPYSDALATLENLQPSYDKQSDIYPDLIDRIDAAVASIVPSATSFGSADIILNGDMNRWITFANSLKLRMGMRIIDANAAVGETAVAEAIAAGVISSNADNISFKFADETFRSPLRRNNGEAAWNDIVICKSFTDVVNERNDPRRGYQMYGWGSDYSAYFGDSFATGGFDGYPLTDDSYIELGAKINPVLGWDWSPGQYDWAFLGWNFRYADELADENWDYLIIDFAEVSFLRAEAIERGIVSGSSEAFYNQGIMASMEYWSVDAADIATYLAQPNVAYATAGATWQEKIGTQKYIAFFPYSSEAFSELRRLDYPVLNRPSKNDVLLPEVASKMLYPQDEVLLNSANTASAISDLGGENSLTAKVWWDVN